MTGSGPHFSNPAEKVFTAILLCGFATTLGIALFSFTVPLLSLDEKSGWVWLGSAFAGFYLAKLLASPLSGLLADRIGPRPLLLGASCVGAVVPLGYLLVPTLPLLYAVQFMAGLISGLIKPVGQAVLGANGPSRSLMRWFALHTIIFNAALFLGPIVGGLLYLERDMTPIILSLSICMALAALAIWGLLPSETRTLIPEPHARGHASANHKQGLVLFIALAGRTMGIGALAAFYPVLLRLMLARSGLTAGLLFAIPSLAASLGLIAVGHCSRDTPRPMTVVVGMLLSALGVFLLGFCAELWEFIIAGTTIGAGTALSTPSAMTMAANLSSHRGKTFGAAHAAAGIGFLLGPMICGTVVRHLHDVGTALQIVAILGAVACMPLMAHSLYRQYMWGKRLAFAAGAVCILAISGFAGAITALHAPAPQQSFPRQYTYTDMALGTIVRLTLVTDNEARADRAASQVIATMRSSRRDYDFRSLDGSIGRINHAAGKYWIKPSPEAYALLKRTLAISKITRGAFDPTIGALTTSPLYYALDERLARSKKPLVNYRHVEMDDSEGRVRLQKQGMALDLGGIAKGTIIDEAAARLKGLGIEAGMVEAGGDFYCFGNREWTIGIRHPRSETVYDTIRVREKGVCGSGDYRQYVSQTDHETAQLRHHIIDPTDMESAPRSIGVTVIADTAETADALATALFIMGPNTGKPFAEETFPEIQALWFRPDLSVTTTNNYQSSYRHPVR